MPEWRWGLADLGCSDHQTPRCQADTRVSDCGRGWREELHIETGLPENGTCGRWFGTGWVYGTFEMPEVEAKRAWHFLVSAERLGGACAADREREEGSSGQTLRNPDVCLGQGGEREPGLKTE